MIHQGNLYRLEHRDTGWVLVRIGYQSLHFPSEAPMKKGQVSGLHQTRNCREFDALADFYMTQEGSAAAFRDAKYVESRYAKGKPRRKIGVSIFGDCIPSDPLDNEWDAAMIEVDIREQYGRQH